LSKAKHAGRSPWIFKEKANAARPSKMPKPAAPAANITLVSADGHKRAVTRQIAEMSALIKEMLVAEGEEGHDDAQEIPLPNIHSKVILDKARVLHGVRRHAR